ncbi:hypothetical protein ACVWZA_002103 [Sphingomonas sp. UYAg733]
MINRTIPLVAVALLALSACNNSKSPEVVTSVSSDPQAEAIANRAPVELPPAMKAEVTFRCKDNSLAYVTFFQGDKQAMLKLEKAGPTIVLKADEAGKPLVAEGYSLTGNPKNITLTQPGKGTLTCRA